jgi:hypothetical protein
VIASAARIAVAAVLAVTAGVTVARAQSPLRLHESIAAPQRPLLCADRGSVNLIMPVLARAADARVSRDADKSQRLTEIATQLQGEVCRKPAADDVVILRCRLGQTDTGGAALTLIKVSALIQTEAAKGEQPFYGWTDLRIDDTPGPQESNARWCASEDADRTTRQIKVEERADSGGGAPAREAEEPFSPTQDIVLRVQQRLFDFGARIENLDGQLNQETVRSIQQFQKLANLNADGTLNRSTVIKMMTTPAPSPWVAIAFDGSGNFSPEIGRTRRNAELVALEQLQRRWSSRDPRVVSVSAPNCLGFAVTRYVERGRRGRTNFTQAFSSAGETMETAAKNAFDYCERDKGGGQCQVRYALCADGSGGNPQADDGGRRQRQSPDGEARRFDRGSPPVNAPNPRVDPKDISVNSRPPKFDPGSPPLNAPAPRFDPLNEPNNGLRRPAPRFDPREMPANAPNPNAR